MPAGPDPARSRAACRVCLGPSNAQTLDAQTLERSTCRRPRFDVLPVTVFHRDLAVAHHVCVDAAHVDSGAGNMHALRAISAEHACAAAEYFGLAKAQFPVFALALPQRGGDIGLAAHDASMRGIRTGRQPPFEILGHAFEHCREVAAIERLAELLQQRHDFDGVVHLPSNLGLRFSMNAAMPSLWSCE